MKDTERGTPPSFVTARFALSPVAPIVGRQLIEYLLRDESLARKLPALQEKTEEGARQLAREIQAEAERGVCKMWSIAAREAGTIIGMLITRNTSDGIDLEMLVSSEHEVYDPTDEVCDPVLEWLDANTETIWRPPVTLH